MKHFLTATLAASVTAVSLHAADDVPKETKDKVSYSVGLNIGNNLKRQGLDVNADMLMNGVKDGLTGAKPRLSEEDMEKTMQAFSTEMREKMQAKQKELSDKNKTAGDAFLTENKKKEGWKALPSGLQYKIVNEGKGEKPKATDTVSVNYRGTLTDGKEFDSSYARNEPAEFPVNGVIPGWTEALQLMPVGAKWQLAIPSTLAYGENAPPEIGPNSVLLFDVELLAIKKDDDKKAAPAGADSAGKPAQPAKK
ncbi:MAG: FKBP-type peptidyl-prolyl cis-trans isomerase FklB [Chthoniobacter sp.]|jgi:FKBP-type peptidyl-prolyl cis-trans isomerase FklB|nr:FKBP-type peptidyl-prolyl cis-trans isomerase FklB [Chthoniobacter sp.]